MTMKMTAKVKRRKETLWKRRSGLRRRCCRSGALVGDDSCCCCLFDRLKDDRFNERNSEGAMVPFAMSWSLMFSCTTLQKILRMEVVGDRIALNLVRNDRRRYQHIIN